MTRRSGTSRGVLLALLSLGLLLPACGSSGAPHRPIASSSVSGTRAPDFTLTDQFGRPEQLSAFRGRTVLLTFIDSRCTTLCPLTAELMTRIQADLGSGTPVELMAVNANPQHTKVSDVRTWSVRHRMLHRWLFLTGSVRNLKAVWADYGIQAKVVHGDVEHTAVVFLIDPTGMVRTAFPIATRKGIGDEATSIATAIDQLVPSAS